MELPYEITSINGMVNKVINFIKERQSTLSLDRSSVLYLGKVKNTDGMWSYNIIMTLTKTNEEGHIIYEIKYLDNIIIRDFVDVNKINEMKQLIKNAFKEFEITVKEMYFYGRVY